MIPKWLCVGGPIHGQWRPAGQQLIPATDPDAKVDYAIRNVQFDGRTLAEFAQAVVAVPGRPALYYPRRMEMPGWRVGIPLYIDARILGGGKLPTGTIMPGWVVDADLDAEVACRWCFGRAMEGMDVCSRVTCIANVTAINFLDVATGEDANWKGDRP